MNSQLLLTRVSHKEGRVFFVEKTKTKGGTEDLKMTENRNEKHDNRNQRWGGYHIIFVSGKKFLILNGLKIFMDLWHHGSRCNWTGIRMLSTRITL